MLMEYRSGMTSTDVRETDGGTRGATGRRTKRTSGPTRERLLAAARESFAKLGFASTRVADIVALASTSHGTFYTYFDDKRDALLALPSRPRTRSTAPRSRRSPAPSDNLRATRSALG